MNDVRLKLWMDPELGYILVRQEEDYDRRCTYLAMWCSEQWGYLTKAITHFAQATAKIDPVQYEIISMRKAFEISLGSSWTWLSPGTIWWP